MNMQIHPFSQIAVEGFNETPNTVSIYTYAGAYMYAVFWLALDDHSILYRYNYIFVNREWLKKKICT